MNTNLTDITIILDRSGSMQSICDDMIGGFNSLIADQKAVPGDAVLSLIQFDDRYESVYSAVNIKDVSLMTKETFVPRGSTALLDSIGRGVTEAGERFEAMKEEDRPANVLVVIMTDGQENSSYKFSRSKIFSMLTLQREKYKWQILFIGANQDAISTGAGLGIMANSSINYAATSQGTQSALRAVSSYTTAYRTGSKAPPESFFSEEAKADQA